MRTFPNLLGKCAVINLNEESKKVSLNLNDPKICEKWIQELHRQKNVRYSYGGFLENRSDFLRDSYNKEHNLFIHLGVDYNVPAGTEVALTEESVLADIFEDSDQNGGWGKRAIFRILNGQSYLIYGHLKRNSELKLGKIYKPGEIIGVVGDSNENGGWWPHLHIQFVTRKFILAHKPDFNRIDGYAAENSPLINEVMNPEFIIY
jgi:hypothetical protein